FKEVFNLLEKGEDFALATILSRSGSAPRVAGTRMIVRSDGSIIGTIGGGIFEAQTQQLAGEVLKERKPRVEEFTLRNEDAGRLGMICGGQVEVLVQPLESSNDFFKELYRELVGALNSQDKAWLITQVPKTAEQDIGLIQCLVKADRSVIPEAICGDALDLVSRAAPNQSSAIEVGDRCFLIEPLCRAGEVYIFGAGHISQQLAPLTELVGFGTTDLDDRIDFCNKARFPTADRLIVLDSWQQPMAELEIAEESYLVIVTRGHAYDKTVLAHALKTPARYIGMIGSRKKRDAIYKALMSEGFKQQDLERVHSPIGLAIGAETPQEIAVSIVSELIQERARSNS
ncbi:MAG: XdhC family aldehyde oxidoreductase maturation factor, partial [Desulfoferrobacter sp.]